MGSYDHYWLLLTSSAILHGNGVIHLHLRHPHVCKPSPNVPNSKLTVTPQYAHPHSHSDALVLLPPQKHPHRPPLPPRDLPLHHPNPSHHRPPLSNLIPLHLHHPNLVHDRSAPRHNPLLNHPFERSPTIPIFPRQRLSSIPRSIPRLFRHPQNDGQDEGWMEEGVW